MSTIGEQAVFYDANPEAIRADHLNNFRLWLPGSSYFDTMVEFGTADTPRGRDEAGRHSELWASQTARQFHDAIAGTLAELPDVQAALDGVKRESERLREEAAAYEPRIRAAMEALSDATGDERRRRFAAEVRPLLGERDELLYQAQAGEARRIEEAVLPLYVALRRKGYSHYDLIA